jgi:UDPglucose 6-dehydrogenase
MALICEAFGADWDKVREGWLRDPRAGGSHTRVEGRGGFGGRCFPKDLAALIAASKDAGYRPRFLEDVRDTNARFRARGGARFRARGGAR